MLWAPLPPPQGNEEVDLCCLGSPRRSSPQASQSSAACGGEGPAAALCVCVCMCACVRVPGRKLGLKFRLTASPSLEAGMRYCLGSAHVCCENGAMAPSTDLLWAPLSSKPSGGMGRCLPAQSSFAIPS